MKNPTYQKGTFQKSIHGSFCSGLLSTRISRWISLITEPEAMIETIE
jgi:hypothetical protein